MSKVLDFAVVPGFSKVGFLIRKRLGGWSEISDFDLTGKTVVITGPTSGLGAEVARLLAPTGAKLILVGRNPQKLAAMIAEIEPTCAAGMPDAVLMCSGSPQPRQLNCQHVHHVSE